MNNLIKLASRIYRLDREIKDTPLLHTKLEKQYIKGVLNAPEFSTAGNEADTRQKRKGGTTSYQTMGKLARRHFWYPARERDGHLQRPYLYRNYILRTFFMGWTQAVGLMEEARILCRQVTR